MASIWEEAISILVGNLNSGRSYLNTAVRVLLGAFLGARKWKASKESNRDIEVKYGQTWSDWEQKFSWVVRHNSIYGNILNLRGLRSYIDNWLLKEKMRYQGQIRPNLIWLETKKILSRAKWMWHDCSWVTILNPRRLYVNICWEKQLKL